MRTEPTAELKRTRQHIATLWASRDGYTLRCKCTRWELSGRSERVLREEHRAHRVEMGEWVKPRKSGPDWADVREAARKAGYRLSRTAKRRRNDRRMWLWYALDGEDPIGEFHKTSTGVQVHLRGPKGYTALLEFSAAEVLSAARLVGLGGDSDA
jgi:hypothetical protein